jgi:hypothetical protein
MAWLRRRKRKLGPKRALGYGPWPRQSATTTASVRRFPKTMPIIHTKGRGGSHSRDGRGPSHSPSFSICVAPIPLIRHVRVRHCHNVPRQEGNVFFRSTSECLAIADGYGLVADPAANTVDIVPPFRNRIQFDFSAQRAKSYALARVISEWVGDFQTCIVLITESGIWPSSEIFTYTRSGSSKETSGLCRRHRDTSFSITKMLS